MKKDTPMTTLGAVMIVKNEEKNFGGILSDIRDVVDEICVVDTGSTDGTVPLAESFGARIEHFPWCNDFSAARNHSLACAQSDYLLWLDADDRIDETGREALRALKPGLRPGKDRAYMLKILGRSQDMPDTVSYQTRIIPNREDVRFEGRVHEQILPSLKKAAVPIEPADITIVHTGYHDREARAAKARRNLNILKEELDCGRRTANQYFFMAMACIGVEDFEQCLQYLTEARKRRTNEDWHHYSFTVSTDCLLRLGRTDDACREIEAGTRLYPESPLLHYYLGVAYLQAGRFAQAAGTFERASCLPQRVDSYPTPPDLGSIILLKHGRALERAGKTDEAICIYTRALQSGNRQKSLYHALGMAHLQAGRIDEALVHLGNARDLSEAVDTGLWLSIARIHRHRRAHDQAHALYRDVLQQDPACLHALAGILDTSIDLDDTDTFLSALEQLLVALGMPIPESVLDSLAECSELCMSIAVQFKGKNEPALARSLTETALRLDASNSGAHLFLADLFAEQGDAPRMLASLETALKNGADKDKVLGRIDLARQRCRAKP